MFGLSAALHRHDGRGVTQPVARGLPPYGASAAPRTGLTAFPCWVGYGVGLREHWQEQQQEDEKEKASAATATATLYLLLLP